MVWIQTKGKDDKMGNVGETVREGYMPYMKTRSGYRWEIYNKQSGRSVYGRDGNPQYPTKKEAEYNQPDLSNYYVGKVYYG